MAQNIIYSYWEGTKGPLGFPGGSAGKETTCNAGDLGSILGWKDPLEKAMATHSWRILWTV